MRGDELGAGFGNVIKLTVQTVFMAIKIQYIIIKVSL